MSIIWCFQSMSVFCVFQWYVSNILKSSWQSGIDKKSSSLCERDECKKQKKRTKTEKCEYENLVYGSAATITRTGKDICVLFYPFASYTHSIFSCICGTLEWIEEVIYMICVWLSLMDFFFVDFLFLKKKKNHQKSNLRLPYKSIENNNLISHSHTETEIIH